MLYRLIVLSGPLKGERITVELAPMTLGRDPSCQIHLDDEEVARHHAVFEHGENGLVVRDLGTMNRILVNKREVREAHLKHGDEVEIGRTRFLVQALLQTEVEGREDAPSPPRRRRMVLLIIALLLSVLLYSTWRGGVPSRPLPPAESAEVAAPEAVPPVVPVTGDTPAAPAAEPVPAELTEELRTMRSTLDSLKASVADLSEIKNALTQMTPTSSPASQAVAPPPPGALPPDGSGWLRIASVEQSKLPRSERFEEIRQFAIWLVAAGGVVIDPAAVRLQAQVYTRDEQTGQLHLSRAVVSIGRVRPPEGLWSDGRAGQVTIQYKVPEGGDRAPFYGYLLRVYYRDVLQEEAIRPRTLLNDIEEAVRRLQASSESVSPGGESP